MTRNIAGSFRFAAIAAVIGFCFMVLFLATGAMSPEPRDHPAWMERPGRTLTGHVLHLIVTFLCLPAFVLAGLVVASWGVWFWVTACLAQAVLFFGGGLGIAEVVRWLKSPSMQRLD